MHMWLFTFINFIDSVLEMINIFDINFVIDSVTKLSFFVGISINNLKSNILDCLIKYLKKS